MIANLQVLRGLAAVGVVYYHTDFRLAGDWHTEFFGVAAFFVISGFIMCFIARERAGGFLRKRFERIVPMYWVCTWALILLTFKLPADLIRDDTPLDLLRSVLFVPTDKFPLLAVGWTLNFEIYFYVIFAMALAVNRRYAPLLAAVVICSVFWLSSAGYGGFLPRYYSNDYIRYFLAGIAIYYGWMFSRGFAPRTVTIVFSGAVILFCYGSQFVRPLWPDWMIPFIRYAPPLIVASALFLESSGAALTWKPLLLLGDASYSIYLTHPIFFKIAESHLRKMEIGARPSNDRLLMLIFVVGSTVVGILVHLLIEKPLLRRIRRSFTSDNSNDVITDNQGRQAVDVRLHDATVKTLY